MTRSVVSAGSVACHVLTVVRDDGPRTYYQLEVPPVGAVVSTPHAAAQALRNASELLRRLAEQADELASVVELQQT